MWGDRCFNGEKSSPSVYIYQIIMLYTLNIYNFICQIYPSKVGGGEKNSTDWRSEWSFSPLSYLSHKTGEL